MNHKSINYESEQNTERVNGVHEAMPAYAVPRKRQGNIPWKTTMLYQTISVLN